MDSNSETLRKQMREDSEELKRQIENNNETLQQQLKEDIRPVSYTHLDVYKRQIITNSNKFL